MTASVPSAAASSEMALATSATVSSETALAVFGDDVFDFGDGVVGDSMGVAVGDGVGAYAGDGVRDRRRRRR